MGNEMISDWFTPLEQEMMRAFRALNINDLPYGADMSRRPGCEVWEFRSGDFAQLEPGIVVERLISVLPADVAIAAIPDADDAIHLARFAGGADYVWVVFHSAKFGDGMFDVKDASQRQKGS